MVRVAFFYPGGKWHWMGNLLPMLPQHNHYVSVFGGSGADISRKPPSPRETFNDIDPHICNVFRVIQSEDHCRRLADMIRVPHCRDIYEAALRVLHQPIADPIKSAAAFLIVADQGKCIGHPCLKHRRDWWTRIKDNAQIKVWLSLPDALPAIRQRFVSVQIEQQSWYASIKKHASPTTLLFVDPPYFPGTVARYYPVEMTVNEHRAMLAVLKQVPGFVIICGYDNVVYQQELGHWHRIEMKTEGHINPSGVAIKKTGYIWLNYTPATTPLWTP